MIKEYSFYNMVNGYKKYLKNKAVRNIFNDVTKKYITVSNFASCESHNFSFFFLKNRTVSCLTEDTVVINLHHEKIKIRKILISFLESTLHIMIQSQLSRLNFKGILAN